jgi:hypothetical protein
LILVLDDHHNPTDQLACKVFESEAHKIKFRVSKSESAQIQLKNGKT